MTVFVEPSPVAVVTTESPHPSTCTKVPICTISPVDAASAKTTDVPLLAVKSVVGLNLTPFKYTSKNPGV